MLMCLAVGSQIYRSRGLLFMQIQMTTSNRRSLTRVTDPALFIANAAHSWLTWCLTCKAMDQMSAFAYLKCVGHVWKQPLVTEHALESKIFERRIITTAMNCSKMLKQPSAETRLLLNGFKDRHLGFFGPISLWGVFDYSKMLYLFIFFKYTFFCNKYFRRLLHT